MRLIPKSKVSRKVAPNAVTLSNPTPKTYPDLKVEIADYLPLTGGTVTGNLTVNGNSKLGNASTDTVGLYDATAVARQNHITDAPEITSADSAGAAAATATTIAAAVPAAPPNVDEDGIAAGGFITRAARLALVQTVIDLRTHSVEMDLDYEALLVDVADIRTKYAAAVTLANELKTDVNLAKTAINTILVRLETIGINKTS